MNSSGKDFKFDRRAEAYDEGIEGKFSQRFYSALLSLLDLNPSDTVLDAGCGTGHLLRRMSGLQDINGYGIDTEPKMTEQAKRKCPEMTIMLSPCEQTPFENEKFDAVTACMAYHHFPGKKEFAEEAQRILKKGGCLYIADPYFPYPVRKAINGLLRLLRITGRFFTAEEIEKDFGRFGFEAEKKVRRGIVQAVKLRKTGREKSPE